MTKAVIAIMVVITATLLSFIPQPVNARPTKTDDQKGRVRQDWGFLVCPDLLHGDWKTNPYRLGSN